MDDSSKNKPTTTHLHDALKNINDALEEWDKITNKPLPEQDLSPTEAERPSQDLLIKLREQLNELSDDTLL
ncbi:hypothetical protein K2X05_04750 [bacterium]|nr:hypothetical protein [bacterium]